MLPKTLIVVAHPDLVHSTVSKAWIEALLGHVTIHSLYDTYPAGTPIDVAHEQALVEQHSRIIFQFPLYWYSAPALLKTWMDEVFREGWAYGSGGDAWVGREMGVAVSCGSSEDKFAPGQQQLHSLATYLSPYEGAAAFARATYIGFHAFYDTYNPTVADRLPENCEAYLRFATEPLQSPHAL